MKHNRNGGGTPTVGVLIVAIALFLWADPYTHGRVGGEYAIFSREFEQLPVYGWQILGSIFLIVLLLVGLSLYVRGSSRTSIRWFATEFGFFVFLNAVYVLRDGLIVRGTAGDEGALQPAMVTIGGLVCRLILLAFVARTPLLESTRQPGG
jgi:hypothetical protein